MTVRFGLIGYGLWGRHHARAIAQAPGATLAAIACRTPETAAAARTDWPDAVVELDYRALLVQTDIDAVDIVVPNDLHEEIGAAALEAGKDVLLEKPLAPTLAACDRLIETARRTGRVLSVGHELRLSEQCGAIKRIIDGGDLGDLRCVVFNLFRFPYRPGSGGWRHDPRRVGSWVMEELVHHFDLLLWYFADVGDPAAISAVGVSRDGDTALTEAVTVTLEFPGGRYAVVTLALRGFEYHLRCEVVGGEGALRAWWSAGMDRTRQADFGIALQRRGASAPVMVPLAVSGELFELETQLARTVAAFRERRPLVSGNDARKAVALCLAVEHSLRAERPVLLDSEERSRS
jgi:myo-inositol 2-dehydrogenase/D-chiro-inositol 1-dehydrogenase